MKAIDLLALESAPHEELLEDMLVSKGLELHFNERLVGGDILGAVVAGRRDIASSSGLDEESVTPHRLDVALYHPEERAIYVAVDYLLPVPQRNVRAERKLTVGRQPRTVELAVVSVGTSARILELMDALDLTRVLWLPLR